jgi:head-tail adaptor
MILSGWLNIEIELETRVDSKDSLGFPMKGWGFWKRKWASHKDGNPNGSPDLPVTTDTFNQNLGRYISYYDTFTIRYDVDVNYQMRILYNNIYYKIIKINPVERKQKLIIYAEKIEGNNYGVQ